MYWNCADNKDNKLPYQIWWPDTSKFFFFFIYIRTVGVCWILNLPTLSKSLFHFSQLALIYCYCFCDDWWCMILVLDLLLRIVRLVNFQCIFFLLNPLISWSDSWSLNFINAFNGFSLVYFPKFSLVYFTRIYQ